MRFVSPKVPNALERSPKPTIRNQGKGPILLRGREKEWERSQGRGRKGRIAEGVAFSLFNFLLWACICAYVRTHLEAFSD